MCIRRVERKKNEPMNSSINRDLKRLEQCRKKITKLAPKVITHQNRTDNVASQPCGVLLMPIDGRFLASCSLR